MPPMTDTTDAHSLDGAPPPMVRREGFYPDPTRDADLRWWDGERWTAHTRPFDADSRSALQTWGYVLGILFPIAGMIISIVLLGRNRVGPGLSVLATSILGTVIWFALTNG